MLTQACNANGGNDRSSPQNRRNDDLLLVVGDRLTDLQSLVADQIDRIARNALDDDVLLVVHFGSFNRSHYRPCTIYENELKVSSSTLPIQEGELFVQQNNVLSLLET